MNLWPALSNDLPSPRTEILYNIDDIFQHSAIVQGEWKVIRGLSQEISFLFGNIL